MRRRLQIFDDLIDTLGLPNEILWVPTDKNRADQLTRVPHDWIKYAKSLAKSDVSATCLMVIGPVSTKQIRQAQQQCEDIQQAIRQLENGEPVSVVSYMKVRDQLCVHKWYVMS